MNKSRRGQVVIWIIIAVVFLASIVLFFLVNNGEIQITPTSGGETVFEMDSYLSSCAKTYVEEAVDILLPQGGFIKNRNAYFFDGKEIELWVDSGGFFDRGVSQHPRPFWEVEQEIIEYVQPRIEAECFTSMEEEFESRGSQVTFLDERPIVQVDLKPNKIILDIERKTKIVKNDETRTFENVEVEIASPLYEIIGVANEIATQESRYCYFEYVGYSILYPDRVVTQYAGNENSIKFYRIFDEDSEKEMTIGISSCVIPGGIQ